MRDGARIAFNIDEAFAEVSMHNGEILNLSGVNSNLLLLSTLESAVLTDSDDRGKLDLLGSGKVVVKPKLFMCSICFGIP